MANQALTVIKIIKGAPCDDTYSDVIKFGSAGAQAAYFSGLAKYTFSNCSYQRVNNSVASPRSPLTCRIPTVADNVYDCNYVMFQNQAFGSKWFYAFIRRINYINPDTTEIEYEIDSYQTYQFDYTVKPSLVEREHPEDDQLFANLIAEDFAEPFIVSNNSANQQLFSLGDGSYCQVYATQHDSGFFSCFQFKDNIFQGTDTFPRPDETSVDTIKGTLNGYVEHAGIDKVCAIVTTPFKLADQHAPVNWVCRMSDSLNGYTPKYKKCFNYPYNYLEISDLAGNKFDYLYEKFSKQTYGSDGKISVTINDPTFKISYFTGYPPCIKVMPVNYSDISAMGNENWDNSFIIGNFPETNFSAGKVDLAVLRGVEDILKLGVSMLFGGATGKSGKAASKITGVRKKGSRGSTAYKSAQKQVEKGVANGYNEAGGLSQIGDDFVSTLTSHYRGFNSDIGNINSRLFNFKENQNYIVAQQMCASAEFISKLDQYFDMYGYATNAVKVPNEDSRESWNYVKTDNVIINGSMPVQDMAEIKDMYNSGVRFWHTTDVGNYSLSNRDKKEVVTDDVG